MRKFNETRIRFTPKPNWVHSYKTYLTPTGEIQDRGGRIRVLWQRKSGASENLRMVNTKTQSRHPKTAFSWCREAPETSHSVPPTAGTPEVRFTRLPSGQQAHGNPGQAVIREGSPQKKIQTNTSDNNLVTTSFREGVNTAIPKKRGGQGIPPNRPSPKTQYTYSLSTGAGGREQKHERNTFKQKQPGPWAKMATLIFGSRWQFTDSNHSQASNTLP